MRDDDKTEGAIKADLKNLRDQLEHLQAEKQAAIIRKKELGHRVETAQMAIDEIELRMNDVRNKKGKLSNQYIKMKGNRGKVWITLQDAENIRAVLRWIRHEQGQGVVLPEAIEQAVDGIDNGTRYYKERYAQTTARGEA